jgi:small GTP-binding protein
MSNMPLLKVVVAGDGNVGKTSLIRQYCEGKFEASRVATIGVDFQTKVVQLAENVVKLSIWDMAGQIHFKTVRSGLYRGSQAAALVYDVTNETSLAHLPNWHQEIIEIVPQQRFLVVGNKVDLSQGNHDAAAAQTFAKSINAPYVETSALTGERVPDMFKLMALLAIVQ